MDQKYDHVTSWILTDLDLQNKLKLKIYATFLNYEEIANISSLVFI